MQGSKAYYLIMSPAQFLYSITGQNVDDVIVLLHPDPFMNTSGDASTNFPVEQDAVYPVLTVKEATANFVPQ